MTAPSLRAEVENGQTYDDPSEDALFEILGDVDAGEALWVIVERLDDPNQQTYAQALRDKDGTYVVERRLGTPDTHEATRTPDMRSAQQLLTAWAFAL
jgi:hypothetical protein